MRILLILTAVLAFATMARGQTAQLLPQPLEDAYRAAVPVTDDDDINAIVKDPRTIFYDRSAIPLIYWQGGTFRDGLVDIGPGNQPRPHNGSRAFPWNGPGGVDAPRSSGGLSSVLSGTGTYKFMWLPPGEVIAWHLQRRFEYNTLRGGQPDGYLSRQRYPIWVFPSGTVFGEVLGVRGRNGLFHPFELRIRSKEWDEWGVDIFRPFPRANDLLLALPPTDPVARHLESPRKVTHVSLRDSYPHSVAVHKRAAVDRLPAFGPEVQVAELLGREFRSALGVEWATGADGFTVGNGDGPHIIPVGYTSGLMGGDRYDCGDCHESTAVDVSKFHIGRDWYGYIRGSDRILSFHIADPNSLSSNRGDRPWRVNPKMRMIVERYDPSKHKIHHNTTKAK